MSIPAFSVKRPVTSIMIVLALIILGGVALFRLPLALLPEMNFPAAVVITDYPNVGPQEVEQQISRPVEEVMATVRNVRRVSSTSSPGSSTVIVEFNWGTDMDFAALEMREHLDLIRGFLPDGAEQPQVFRFDPSMQPIFQFNVGGFRDPALLRRFVDDNITSRLERIDGVAQVSVSGGLEREIRVEIDQSRLEARGMSIEQVAQALGAGNVNLPGGRIEESHRELTIRTVGEFADIEEIGQTVIGAGAGGVVRVQDVATVIDGFKDTHLISRLNGEPSVAITLQKEAGANTVTVSDAIRKTLTALEEEFAGEVFMQVVWDEADFIRFSLKAVVENAVSGAIIAGIILFVFLRSIGATFVVATSIPVAGMATFFFLYVLDVSLNILSLGGIALGVGMLVDNAIVSLENIVRHRQLGKEPEEAAIKGTEEVATALGASTLTTMAVFLPIVFVGGLAAELFRDLSFAVVFSLFMSLVVAVTFVPMVSARARISIPIDVTDEDDVPADGDGVRGALGRAGRASQGFFMRMQRAYGRYLEWILKKRWVAVATVLVLALSAAALYPFVGRSFLPETDTGEIGVRVRLPYGSTSAQTDGVLQELEQFISGIPDVETVFAAVGGRDGSTGESGIMHVGMVERGRRRQKTTDVIESIRRFGETMPGVEVRAAMQDPFGAGDVGGAPIILKLSGGEQEQLRLLAEEVAVLLSQVEGTRDVEVSTRAGRPELQVVVDRERAARHGLSVAQIASSLRTAVDGVVATRYRVAETGTEVDVRVQLAEEWRGDTSSLERVRVATPLGGTVPLWEVAQVTEGIAPVAIDREDQARVVTVSAHLVGRSLDSATADVRKQMETLTLPGDVQWSFGGDSLEMDDAFGSLSSALVLAVLLVYMIMAAQFESLVHPFVIMITVPLGFIGVIWALAVSGRPLSVPALVGVIMLAGIVVNNGIVMIDYVNQLRVAGRSRFEALVTGSATRLRPVLMTALTTILGMLPLAIGLGEGQELAAPIATVVMGGLLVSTVLTLGFIPVAYSLFDDMGLWFATRFARMGRRSEEAEVRDGEVPSGDGEAAEDAKGARDGAKGSRTKARRQLQEGGQTPALEGIGGSAGEVPAPQSE